MSMYVSELLLIRVGPSVGITVRSGHPKMKSAMDLPLEQEVVPSQLICRALRSAPMMMCPSLAKGLRHSRSEELNPSPGLQYMLTTCSVDPSTLNNLIQQFSMLPESRTTCSHFMFCLTRIAVPRPVLSILLCKKVL